MSRRIRWGILGAANIARKRFIPGAQQSTNGEVVAIASRDLAKAQSAASELGIARAYGSYDELLADPNVDAIYNPLPNSLHAEWTMRAADAGKPILCEKPLALDAAEAQAMIDHCRAKNVPLMEAFMYRFHPQHARVRELIDSGAIGELRFVRSAFTFLLEPFPPGNVRLSAPLGGGALMDVGCYCIDAARMLFGEEPQWASAQWDFRDAFGVEVSCAATLGFSDGRTAIFDCGFRASGQGSYTVAGTRGQIDVPNAFVPSEAPTTVAIWNATDGRREETIPGVQQYRLEAEAFAAALLNGTPVPMLPEDAVATLRVIAACKTSARRNGVRVPV